MKPSMSTPEREELTCPFCQETEFDAIGLKIHFIKGQCEPFEATGTVCVQNDCPYYGKAIPSSCQCHILRRTK
jgi:hypothetical protein